MAELSNHESSTLDWYLERLREDHPDWTDEQCLEIATGFVQQQQRPIVLEPALEESAEETNEESKRKAERHLHRMLGGLMKEGNV